MSFIASTMHRVLPFWTVWPTSTNAGAPGEGERYTVPTIGDSTTCRPSSFADAADAGADGWPPAGAGAAAGEPCAAMVIGIDIDIGMPMAGGGPSLSFRLMSESRYENSL